MAVGGAADGPPPASDIRDIYGWRFAYNIGAESTDAVRAATETFMDNATKVAVAAADPVAYALAVQQADSRGYVESEHFYKKSETAASEYAAALPAARAAYVELRGRTVGAIDLGRVIYAGEMGAIPLQPDTVAPITPSETLDE